MLEPQRPHLPGVGRPDEDDRFRAPDHEVKEVGRLLHRVRPMRDNDAVMQDMAAQRKAVDPASITAVEDLRWYEKFAKAHVTGLRKLIVSFETLYGSMPNAQKGVADHVFKSFGRPETRASN